jgi:hypothetical protein
MCKCCEGKLENKWELFRGTCDKCVELYNMGAYPMGFPNKNVVNEYINKLIKEP